MPAPGSPLHVNHTSGVMLVTFRDRILLDTEELKIIEKDLLALVVGHPGVKVVVDFENVQSLSSQMLGALLKLGDQVGRLDGRLGLCNVNRNIRRAFEITKLKRIFRIYDTQIAAIRGVT